MFKMNSMSIQNYLFLDYYSFGLIREMVCYSIDSVVVYLCRVASLQLSVAFVSLLMSYRIDKVNFIIIQVKI